MNNQLLASDNFASGSLALDSKRQRSAAWMRQWRAANPEKARARNRVWREEHPEATDKYNEKRRGPAYARKRKESKVRSAYGICLAEYESRIVAQHNLCAICQEPMDSSDLKGGRAPALDHNHETGNLREFVHNDCNRGLGCFDDNLAKLKLAVAYMEKHNGQ